MKYPRFHEAAHSVACRRAIKDTSRQGRYHNRRFQIVARELGLQVAQDSAFGSTQTALRASTAVEYSGVLRALELYLPQTRQRSVTAENNQRPSHGIRTLACPCGRPLVRAGRSAFVADATICSGCLSLDPRKRRTTGMKEGNGRVLHRRSSESRWPRPCVGDPRGRSEALGTGCAQAGYAASK
jgi:hypothetical protein